MSFPRYPKYKDSGVEWLGEVPEHWEVNRLKRTCHIFPSNVDKKSHEGETPIVLCNYTDVYYNEKITPAIEFMAATASPDQIAKFTLRSGDTIITKDSETADDIAVAAYVPHDLPGVVCGYHLSMVRPLSDVSGAFVARLFGSVYAKSKFAILANGLTRVGLGKYELDNVVLPFPPISEQVTIASFLDRETAKIDELIAEQRRLIELLKEKRQAVISHAVTKGLDPNVRMKPSGVEWLGEVPEHWGVEQSRRLFKVRNEPARDTDEQLTASQKHGILLQSEFVELEGRRVVETIKGTDTLRHVEPNDFIISLRSFQGGIEWSRIRGAATFHYVVLVAIKNVHPPYFAHLFKSITYIQALRSTADLIRDGQDLRFSHFIQVDLPIVPLSEQKAIAAYLDVETAKFDSLINEAQRAIDLLQERRTALISAAVTGKIDVRGLAATEVA
jgi:type I restriction enzyme S subunit